MSKMDKKTLESQLRDVTEALKPLLSMREKLKTQILDAESADFISLSKITINDVELSYGDGKPWFGLLGPFCKWVADNSDKRFIEWNGRIYTPEGRETPGLMRTFDATPE